MRYGSLAVFVVLAAPAAASAQIAQFVFATSPQTIQPGAVSETFTVQAQNSSGSSEPVPQTGCMLVESSSGGEFSSSATNWNPVQVLTMNSGTANRSFYYKGSGAGTHTLTVRIGLRPSGESRTCAALQGAGEFPAVQWTANQSVTVGAPGDSGTQDTTAAQASTTTSSQSVTTAPQYAPVSSYVPPPEPVLYADAGPDRTVIVGADIEFRGRAYARSKETVAGARLNWNFGDGATREGASVMHHYDYPGTYAVVLTVAHQVDSASDRLVVRAEPAQLGFFIHGDGSATIENRAGRDLDLSRWAVRAFNRDFTLPPESLVLAGASMRISPQTLGFFAGLETTLRYPNGALALAANAASATAEPPPPRAATAAAVQGPAPSVPRAVSRTDTAEEDVQEEGPPKPSLELHVAEAASAARAVSHGGYWWLGALALAGFTGLGVVLSRRTRSGEWDIVEDKG